MLLPPKVAHGVADGSVTLAFRRWRKQDVAVGSEFRTVSGVVRVDRVEVVDPAAITDADAIAAGWPDADRLRTQLDKAQPDAGEGDLSTYRVALSWAGPDPRVALRESADLTDDDVAAIDAKLERLDRASSHGAWTMATLDIIRRRPHTRAPDLAAELGRERDPFKIDVRKLKNLGLTRSFEVGYEVSPRGVAYLDRTTRPLV
ncbi:hypothetical protein ASC77_23010 [Nocardioides sp. Root1257]|uniref:hypothetical protein n=1 Tax=unclassified Nocardioides TaxID=2615069 RepID=UPI0006F3C42F|nr:MULTISPECIES: hypothetical protein [unclassified Nocardioides]KQW42547.1 hypothetical protein ASC77_23010 [Nocardioides sp. Root1257]KRC39805.1 hypothetical protein ASE24_22805 [Nocardioides sp. Root224]